MPGGCPGWPIRVPDPLHITGPVVHTAKYVQYKQFYMFNVSIFLAAECPLPVAILH